MNHAQSLHDAAMLLADEAHEAGRRGEQARFEELSREAFQQEKEAANLLLHLTKAEPTRSVLFRSAAQLALDCHEFKEAEKLVNAALWGNPPTELALELREMSRQINAWFELMAEAENPAQAHDYMKMLRQKALHIRIKPKNLLHGHAIYLDSVIEALSKIRQSFSQFLEIDFLQHFENQFPSPEKLLANLLGEARPVLVGLKFQSFSASISSDSVVMAAQPYSPEVSDWRGQIFERFKNEVFYQNYESLADVQAIAAHYSDSERRRIFSPVVDLLRDSNSYKFSVTDEKFETVKQKYSPISKPMRDILLPPQPQTEAPPALELQQIFGMTAPDSTGAIPKSGIIARQTLTSAQFNHVLNEVVFEKKSLVLHEPIEFSIQYDKPIFSIDFSPLAIRVNGYEYLAAVKDFQKHLIDRYLELTGKPDAQLNADEQAARAFFGQFVFSASL